MDCQDKNHAVVFCQPISHSEPITYCHSECFTTCHSEGVERPKNLSQSKFQENPLWSVEMEILRYAQNNTSFVKKVETTLYKTKLREDLN